MAGQQATTDVSTAATRPAARVRVWDPLVRVFHWTLVGAFAVSYLTGEEDAWLGVHTWSGYLIAALLAGRVLWGLVGTRHARFGDFVYAPRAVLGYLRDVLYLRPKRYLGHNPVGGAMIVLMLVSLVLTVLAGMTLYGIEEGAGPLAGVASGLGEHWEEAVEEVHEVLANFTLFLIIAHVAGVIVESLLHHENLVRSMVTGDKRPE